MQLGKLICLLILGTVYLSGCKNTTGDRFQTSLHTTKLSATPYRTTVLNAATNDLNDAWFNETGTEGWVVGDAGAILHYSQGYWSRINLLFGNARLYNIWMNKQGTEGWICGYPGIFLHYQNRKWTQESEGISNDEVRNISLLADASQGWALGPNGTFFKYQNGTWSLAGERITKFYPSNFIMNTTGSEGWAVGAQGTIVRYYKGEWKKVQPDDFKNLFLNCVWVSENGDQGWIGGDDGTVLRLQSGRWEKINLVIKAGESLDGDNDGHVRFGTTDRTGKFIQMPTPMPGFDINQIRMGEDGTEGWLIGDRGIVMHLKNGKWEQEAVGLTGHDLYNLYINKDGDEGWIAGSKGTILHYSGGVWKLEVANVINNLNKIIPIGKDRVLVVGEHAALLIRRNGKWTEASVGITSSTLRSIWLDRSGSTGWAVGNEGSIIQYIEGKWKKIDQKITTEKIHSLRMHADGNEGWAVDGSSQLLHFRNGSWKGEKLMGYSKVWDIFMSANPDNAWVLSYDDNDKGHLSSDGEVVREGSVLHYKKGVWEKHLYQSRDTVIKAIWLDRSGTEGWAVGEKGVILRYQSGRWHPVKHQLSNLDLEDIWMSDDGKHGFIVGSNGTVLNFSEQTWHKYRKIGNDNFYRLHMRADGKEGWVFAEDAKMYHFVDNDWQLVELNVLQKYFQRITMSDDGGEGWIVSSEDPSNIEDDPYSGNVLIHYENGKWNVCNWSEKFRIYDLQMASNRIVQAVGQDGLIIKFVPQDSDTISIEQLGRGSISELTGSYRIHFTNKLTRFDGLFLSGPDNFSFIDKVHYESILDSGGYDLTIRFKNTQAITSRYLHERFKLGFRVGYSFAANPDTILMETDHDFFINGRPSWFYYAITIAAFMLLNVALVILAVFNRQARWLILHPIGSRVIGLILGKYLITDVLMRFVGPLRNAMFRQYRKELKDAAFIKYWRTEHTYIPPPMIFGKEKVEQSGRVEEEWTVALDEMLKGSTNTVFTLIGRSGLGKTALLENWTAHLLSRGETPVLIRLGTDSTALEEANTIIRHYGDLSLKEDDLQDIFSWGGFVFLLDGFNEDAHQDNTMQFVRLVSKRNIVILSGQDKPTGLRDIHFQEIGLQSFGIYEMTRLIGADWAQKAVQTIHFSEIIQLPQTALLLSGYISRNRRLPAFSIEVYGDLIPEKDDERTGLARLLSTKAWQLFAYQEIVFDPDNSLPENYCEACIQAGILTRSVSKYRFRHERIHRYFTALYIFYSGEFNFNSWHALLDKRQPPSYWSDVIEFTGEFLVQESLVGNGEQKSNANKRYRDFVLQINMFNTVIFSERIYRQFVHFYDDGFIERDETFLLELSKKISNILCSPGD